MHSDDIYDVCEKLNGAADDQGVLELVHGIAKGHGYEHFIVSGLPPRGVNVLPFVLVEAWPSDWFSRYFGKDYTQYDPVARHCFHTTTPFSWADAPYDRDDRFAQRVMDEAGDCGLQAGYCVPVHSEDGAQGCVSFGGSETDLDTEGQLGLHLVSMIAHGRLRAFRRPNRLNSAPKLTAREIEVLKWASHGKSTSDIGELLGLADVTVQLHIKSAAAKLGTLNRTHTVAEALRYQLIPL